MAPATGLFFEVIHIKNFRGNIWVNYNDLTVLPHWNHGFYMGNHPQMAQQFRLVNYYNLPRYIYNIYIYNVGTIILFTP